MEKRRELNWKKHTWIFLGAVMAFFAIPICLHATLPIPLATNNNVVAPNWVKASSVNVSSLLDASPSHDDADNGAIEWYFWTLRAISDSLHLGNSPRPDQPIGLDIGTHILKLHVLDFDGELSDRDHPYEVTIRVNAPPIAEHGQTATTFPAGSPIVLDGTGSYDQDTDGSIYRYAWFSGAVLICNSVNSPTPMCTVDLAAHPFMGEAGVHPVVFRAYDSDLAYDDSASFDITILPNPGTIQLTASTYTIDEEAGTLQVSIIRTGGLSGTTTITLTTEDLTADAGSDYTAQTVDVVFTHNETNSRTVDIPILPDTLTESDEQFRIRIANKSGPATIGSPSQATVTILDNDTGVQPNIHGVFQFSAAEYRVNKAAGEATIIIERLEGSSEEVKVDITDDTGRTEVATLTFSPGETQRQYVWYISNQDSNVITFSLDIPSPQQYMPTLGLIDEAILFIEDDVPSQMSEDDFVREPILNPIYPHRGDNFEVTFTIKGSIPRRINLAIYNLAGRKIKTLGGAQEFSPGGPHTIRWDLKNEDNSDVVADMYFLQIRLDGRRIETVKVVVIR